MVRIAIIVVKNLSRYFFFQESGGSKIARIAIAGVNNIEIAIISVLRIVFKNRLVACATENPREKPFLLIGIQYSRLFGRIRCGKFCRVESRQDEIGLAACLS